MQDSTIQILSDREWILTNGFGGYALGFGNMTNKRKYNGLLISSFGQCERVHTLATIEEKLEGQSNFFYLDANHYLNCIYPNGYKHIVKTWMRPYPCILYTSIPQREDYLVMKEIFFFERENAVAIKYTNVGKKKIMMTLRPKFTLRDHHRLNTPGTWNGASLKTEVRGNSFSTCRSDNGYCGYGYTEGGDIVEETVLYNSVYYPVEANRGYDAVEDMISPVRIRFEVLPEHGHYVVFSSTPLKDPIEGAHEAEKRYKKLPLPADHPEKMSPMIVLNNPQERWVQFDQKAYMKILELAARDFLIEGDDVVAGYPWFGAWGRDTMISLSGLKYLSKGSFQAIRILRKYGSKLNHGLLPNTFGEGGRGLNYDSVDAPLWYVLRSYEFAPKDKALFKNVSHIVLNYLFDSSHPFYVADDGLIEIRRDSGALTWMDAKVYNTPVTPRYGKPVEINALWFNALCALKEMAHQAGTDVIHSGKYKMTADELEVLIERVRGSMEKFVGKEFLADRIENGEPIWELRPNAIIALSLPFDFANAMTMRKNWEIAREKLLTPYGLRSLDVGNPAFKQKYIGNQKQRDLSYHQGTVWTFLLLPFAKLAFKALGEDMFHDELIKEVSNYVWIYRDGFMKGDMASAAEVWDGVDPYFPKGCPAQAWSVFALLEIEHLLAESGGISK